MLRIPTDLRKSWDPETTLSKPDLDFDVEWVYGYRGRDGTGGSNLYQLNTDEICYTVAAVVILYNPASHSQRHYMGHTNDVECLAVHPSEPLIASGQAEGHDHTSSTVQKPHVQVWNFNSLQTMHLIGLDVFETSISSVAFSSLNSDGKSLLAITDSEAKPNLSVWSDIEGSSPKKLTASVASSDAVLALSFYPARQNIIISAGEDHLFVWTLQTDQETGETVLKKKQGLFTKKIPKPKAVTCVAFAAESNEILTGDSDGNVMVWKGVKVVRVLKGAHNGPVGDIAVFDDGSFVSGGEKDGALVVFNDSYELIGAGATVQANLGSVRCIVAKYLEVSEDGSRQYQLLVGTTSNCIAKVGLSVSPDSTDVKNFDVDTSVQGHYGAIHDVSVVSGDKFLSCGDGSVILWDAAARKPVWAHLLHGESVNCVSTSSSQGKVAVGTENGVVYLGHLTLEEDKTNFQTHHSVCEDGIASIAFSPDGQTLAIGSKDMTIYLLRDATEIEVKELTGPTASVQHLDWTDDSQYLRANTGDYELLYWKVDGLEGQQVTEGEDIDKLENKWASYDCPLTFNTLGIWPQSSDGTDINATDVSKDLNVIAAATDFGTVKVYQYPCNQTDASFIELLGHSAHVSGLAFLGHSKLVSGGGREGSLIQRSMK